MRRTGRSGHMPGPAPCAKARVAESAAAPTAPLSSTRRDVMTASPRHETTSAEHIAPLGVLSPSRNRSGSRVFPPAIAESPPIHRPAGSPMFFFFSNRLGCAGSLLLSVLLTLVLLYVLRVI